MSLLEASFCPQFSIISAWCLGLSSLKVKSESVSHSVVSNSLQPHGLYSPWNSPGQNTGVGSLSHLQGIFPTQGLNPGLPDCGQILYQLSHKESPRILEWVDSLFSRRSSPSRNQPRVSCITNWFFTNWAIREANKIFPSFFFFYPEVQFGGIIWAFWKDLILCSFLSYNTSLSLFPIISRRYL